MDLNIWVLFAWEREQKNKGRKTLENENFFSTRLILKKAFKMNFRQFCETIAIIENYTILFIQLLI